MWVFLSLHDIYRLRYLLSSNESATAQGAN